MPRQPTQHPGTNIRGESLSGGTAGRRQEMGRAQRHTVLANDTPESMTEKSGAFDGRGGTKSGTPPSRCSKLVRPYAPAGDGAGADLASALPLCDMAAKPGGLVPGPGRLGGELG